MSPEILLQQFDQISDAPDAVPRLRKFILDLAVRGKLVEQDPKDEPAAELLRRIELAKERQVGISRSKKIMQANNHHEQKNIYNIPQGWQWCRFDNLVIFSAGRTPSRYDTTFWNTGDYPWVSIADMADSATVTGTKETVSEKAKSHIFKADPSPVGTILMSFKLTIGRVCRLGIPAFHNEAIISIYPYLQELDPYLVLFLPLISQSGTRKDAIKGATLNRDSISNLAVPLPPLAEQHRIVAKVDELMKLCDELEATQSKRERRRDRLVAATLHGLNNGEANDENSETLSFEESGSFYFNHLPRLTTRPEHIQQLRRSVLNLAVRGKLASQDPKDEPVARLLERIDQERSLVSKDDRRSDAEAQALLAEECCWEVPQTWNWRGLNDLVLFIDYRGQTPAKVTSGIRLITAKNVRRGYINLEPEEFIAAATYKAWMTRGFPKQGDVLFTTEAPMGNAAVIRLPEKFGLAQRVINFRPYGGLNSDFLVLQLLSEAFQTILNKTATGMTAKGIKAAKLKRLPIALPPLAEQSRIVAKVNELMKLCDELETHITTISTTRSQLLEATLYESLNGRVNIA